MARWHGKDSKVFLGARDISGDIHTIQPDAMADVHDTTVFSSGGWKAEDAGLGSWSASFDGFFDEALGGFEQQLEALLGAAGGVLSIYEDTASAIGDQGFLGSDAILEKKSEPVKVGDLVRLSGSFKGSGHAGLRGRLLHVLATETATASGTAYDSGATGTPTTAGGRANIHVTAVAGGPTFSVIVQHSPDNTSWGDLITFTVTAAGSQTLEATGTVNRYLRIRVVKTSGTSITFVGGFSRY